MERERGATERDGGRNIKDITKIGSNTNRSTTIITLFVGNLPEEMDEEWMRQIFAGAGEVRDTYIPKKRSRFENQKFGFVRYGTKDEGFRAIKMWNAAIIRDHKLMVKFARFSGIHESQYQNKGKKVLQDQQQFNILDAFGKATYFQQIESSKQGEERQNVQYRMVNEKSYAQVLKGGEKQVIQSEIKTLQVHPSGNGWLFRSAIAKIRRLMSAEDLARVFKMEDIHNIEIKAIGGRFVVIIFPDSESRDTTIKKTWISNWFEEIKPWTGGEQAKDERFAWLSCFGMPLHAWSVPTFKEIGNKWGHFIQVDDNTLKESSFERGRILIATELCERIAGYIQLSVGGRNFIVRVEEDESFRTVKSSSLDNQKIDGDPMDDLEKRGAELEKHNDVEANKIILMGKIDQRVVHGDGFKHLLEDSGERQNREFEDMSVQFPKVAALNREKTGEASNEVSSFSSHALDSIVENSLIDIDHPVYDFGNKALSNSINVADAPLITNGKKDLVLHEQGEMISQTNIRASQVEGIDLVVELRPAEIRKRIRSQIYEACMGSSGSEFIENSLTQGGLRQEQEVLSNEMQSTRDVGRKLGVELMEDDVPLLEKMIQLEAKEFEVLQRSSSPVKSHFCFLILRWIWEESLRGVLSKLIKA